MLAKRCIIAAIACRYSPTTARCLHSTLKERRGELKRCKLFQYTTTQAGCGDKQMLRVSLIVIFGFLFAVPAAPVKADWHSFWNRAHLDHQRNNCWPIPFQNADRIAVCQTLSMQLANGWKRQNTLSDVYFDSETQVLNEAGRRKVYSIMATTPEPYRTIYVVQSMNPEAHDRRLESIGDTAGELFANQPAPDIVPVRITPRSWSADYIDSISRKVDTTMPAPRLPTFQDTTSAN